MRAWPGALVLLSVRDPEAWWTSANETIFRSIDSNPFATPEWKAMIHAMFETRWGADIADREASIAAFNAHNARVRSSVPAERLLVWQARDGWEPICNALHLDIPAEPFPRTNTSEEWRAREAMRAEQASNN
jgi:hypothetical protein